DGHRDLFDRLEPGAAGPGGHVAGEAVRVDIARRGLGDGEGVGPGRGLALDEAALGGDLLEGDELRARLHLREDVALAFLEGDVVVFLGRAVGPADDEPERLIRRLAGRSDLDADLRPGVECPGAEAL